jgi:4-hydroxy-tetrahydrodipicolinate synthase
MSRTSLSGVYAAAVTPLKKDFSPDSEALPELLGFLAGRGCHGALLLGTTGEGPSFSPAERETIWRAALGVRQEHPGFRLLAGTGTPSLTETIDLTRMAFDLGFDGVVTLPPYYFRKAGDEGVLAWFREVINRAVPKDGALLGYHFPGVAGIGFSLDLLKRLKDGFPAQFEGIKDSSHDTEFMEALGKQFGHDLTVFSGTDSDFTLALQNQAAGCITAPANLISPSLRQIFEVFRDGNDTAEIQGRVSEKRHALEQFMPFPASLKALLHRLYGLPRWPVRPPLMEISEADEDRAVTELG